MKCSEVKIFGEVCVLSLIYSYVAVCKFCAVHNVTIIRFHLLFYDYSTNVFFNILFVFVILFCVFVLYFGYSVFLYCFVLILYIAVSFLFLYKVIDRCQRLETQLQ